MALKLIKVAKEFNVGLHTIVETLHDKGFENVEQKPTSVITDEMLLVLRKEFQKDLAIKQEADKLARPSLKKDAIETDTTESVPPSTPAPSPSQAPVPEAPAEVKPAAPEAKEPEPVKEPEPPKEDDKLIKRERPALRVVGKIDLEDTKGGKSKKKSSTPKEEDAPVEKTEEPKPVAAKPEEPKEAPKETKPAKEETPAPDQNPSPKPAEAKTADTKSKGDAAPAEDSSGNDVDKDDSVYRSGTPQLRGLKILGKINIPSKKTEDADKNKRKGQGGKNTQGGGQASNDPNKRKRKRKKVQQPVTAASLQESMSGNRADRKRPGQRKDEPKEVSQKEIEDKIRQTMARMGAGSGKKRQKIRREKRDLMREKAELAERNENENGKLQVTEFISVSDLASLINVNPSDVIKACMSLGIFVSINQRLDAEIIEVVASEFGHEVEFISAEEQVEVEEEEVDDPKDLVTRQPIVTVMGHVDHGKTSLLDHIREANVAEGEAGGITQHIGAYEVAVEHEKEMRKITFLDTPGHEAFTAMRARGAKVTDVAVIVVAADDNIMPQTKEAISHAQAAGVPIIFAINKIDKDGADPERIKGELAQMNLLVEDWGGTVQSQDISAKKGTNIDKLLEKILLESDMLELKANPKRRAIGTVLEASLDKGRGYVTKILVENGTLNDGDPIIGGEYSGKVKAMFNERGKRVKLAGPATPVLVLGLNGAPQAGERIKEAASESEAKEIATRRSQILREQANRANKRISLEEIGRRLALGNFKELNLIVKGDVDGSIEALTDSLIKLSMEKIQVNVIHKAVGQIADSDILLASASDAIIIGFQVRPSLTARKLAEKEGVEIKLYSIIYEAIEEVKAAMEGMLEPTKEEEIVGQVEVREVYKISKIGTVAGSYVQEGKLNRNHYIRLIRDGIVVYPVNEGQHAELASLKRFKEDVKEVKTGMECGLTIKNFNDIKVGDVVESYVINEVKATL
ncbi:MAG: translation initiation factor IF-2 [Saprospiraceae bacterium]